MSVALMSLAWDSDLPSTDKMVLLCLCNFANDTGDCWPSISTLVKKTGLSERTVQRAIRRLIDAGILTIKERSGTSTNYRIHPRHIGTPVTVTPPSPRHPTPVTVTPHPRHSDTQTINEPSLNHQLSDDNARDECERVANVWNEMAKPIGLPVCLKVEGERREACQARLRADGLDAIQRAIQRIPKSAFLRGDVGYWSGANIDFLLRPDSVTAILEGKYDDRPKPANNRGSGAAGRSNLAIAIEQGLDWLDRPQAGFS